MQSSLRYTLSMPLAALATVGLFIGMKALITGDFQPQAKIAATQFEINPVADDIVVEPRVTKRAEPTVIDIPPAPPIIEKAKASKPSEPIAKASDADVTFKPTGLDLGSIEIKESDKDATPIVRVAAVAPPRAEKSGHCKVRFDVSPKGQTYNIQTVFCTERMFERPTIKAVAKWNYNPKIRNGVSVSRTGVESVMRFNITDERGQIIPE